MLDILSGDEHFEREFGLEDLRAYLDKAIADRQRCLESEDRV